MRPNPIRWPMLLLATCLAGCGGSVDQGGTPKAASPSTLSKRVMLVGFDCSEPLLVGLKAGKIQGLVVQNPFVMGQLGLKTLIETLDKKTVEPKVDTGEVIITPENYADPKVATLVNPPRIEESGGSGLSGPRTKKWRVMVIPKGTTHEFWKTVHAGAQKAADDLGNVEILWQGPQREDDRIQQIQLVQNAIAARVDGIVLAPLDAKALVKPVEDAIAKGIPVVIIDSGLESTAVASQVATNNYRGGVLAAQRLGEVLKGEGSIILLRYAVGSQSTEERERGFSDTIAKEFPKLVVLSDSEYSGATSDLAQQKSQALLTKFRGKVEGIFCPNESSTFGMYRALEGAGMLAGGK